MAESAFDQIVTDDWPVVEINILKPPNNVLEIEYFQAKFLTLLRIARDGTDKIPSGKLCIVMNVDGILSATMQQQLRAASFIGEVREFVVPSIYCTALVITNPLARFVLECITKIQPLKSVHRIFECREDAMAWTETNQNRQLAGLEPQHE
jgi:hypothetical protein